MPTEPFRTILGTNVTTVLCWRRYVVLILTPGLQEAFSLPCGEADVADVADVAVDEAGWLSNFMQQPKLQARSS